MNLHDQHQTLLRRGMPEHPRLSWREDETGLRDAPPHYWHWQFDNDDWSTMASARSFGVSVNEDDARDLITMHALRWFRGRVERHWNGDFRATKFKDDTFCIGDTLLEAILAATEHLEPKS